MKLTISKADSKVIATNKAIEATVKQTGLDKAVNVYVDRYTPQLVKDNSLLFIAIKQIAIDKQIECKIEF